MMYYQLRSMAYINQSLALRFTNTHTNTKVGQHYDRMYTVTTTDTYLQFSYNANNGVNIVLNQYGRTVVTSMQILYKILNVSQRCLFPVRIRDENVNNLESIHEIYFQRKRNIQDPYVHHVLFIIIRHTNICQALEDIFYNNDYDVVLLLIIY